MKNKIATLCFLFLGFTMYAQDAVRNLDNYSELDVSGGIKVELIAGNDSKAEIEMIKGDIENLKTEVSGDRLKIYFSKKSSWTNNGGNKASIKLYFTSLEAVHASAGANIKSDSPIKTNTLKTSASSGGGLQLKIEATRVAANVSSGGRAKLEGSSSELKINASSGGNFQGSDLKCKDVAAKATSGGQAKVWVTNSLSARANSGGGVKYKGNPSDLDVDSGKMSGGYVKKM